MQTTLVKTAHNPLIYEVQDFGVAMTNHRGQLISEGSGLPGFLACLPPTIQAGIALIGAENFREGDVILTNVSICNGFACNVPYRREYTTIRNQSVGMSRSRQVAVMLLLTDNADRTATMTA